MMGNDVAIAAARRRAVDGFVRARYGLRGTLRLHRAALGADLLRAPVNVALAPVFLLSRLAAWACRLAGMNRASRWLAERRVFLRSDLSRALNADLSAFIFATQSQGLLPEMAPDELRPLIADYTDTRNAVAEITTSMIVLGSGLGLFGTVTPGVISLAGPVAELRARAEAIDGFIFGSTLGRMWQGWFPAEPGLWPVLLTGVLLAVAASVVTAFAGLLADPVQVASGTHRRRLIRLFARIEDRAGGDGLAREHVIARSGDLADAALTLWRGLRG